MVYSDTTNKNGLLQRCEYYTGLGDAGITGSTLLKAQFTQSLNNWLQKITTMIFSSMDGWDYDDVNHTDFPILTTNLVADQQDYGIPAAKKILKIKRVEISYDGTNWYKAEPFDINERGQGTSTTLIAGAFTTSKPKYDLQYNSIFLYPIPTSAVSGGLKIWVSREIDEFTISDTTKEPGIDEPFHEMLAAGASFDYTMIKRLANKNDLWTIIQDFEVRLKKFYGKKEDDRVYQLKGSYTDYN